MSKVDLISPRELSRFFWLEGDLSYKLDGLQTLMNDTVLASFLINKKTCVLSSRQIGNSFWVLCFALGYLLRNPKTICRVIAPTKDKCDEIVEDNFNVIIDDIPAGLISRSTTKNRYNLYNKSSLRIGALERQYVDKNRGGNASLIIYEECGFVSPDDFNYGVNSVIGPQLLRSKGNEIFVSSPSEQPDHPLHVDVAPMCEQMGTLFQYTVFDSTTISDEAILEAGTRSRSKLTKDFVYEVRSLVRREQEKIDAATIYDIAERYPSVVLSDDFKREYLADIIRPKSLMIVPIFHQKSAVVKQPLPAAFRKIVAVDWGGVRDKTVSLMMVYNYNADEDWIIDEKVFDANTPTNEIMQELKQWEEDHKIFARWADVNGQLQIDLYDRYEYMVQVPPKTDWKSAVNTMSAKFALDKIKIYPNCTFTIQSIKTGIFNKTRTDFERNSKLGHMDALAALMYGIRVQDRSNPYEGNNYTPPDQIFVPPSSMVSKNQERANKISGRRFGRFK